MKITVRKNESSDSMIKRLKINLNKFGITKNIKNKMFYIKPTHKKKIKKINKILKIQKSIRKKYI